MTQESIWASDELRKEWVDRISEKAVDLFEKFVRAENPKDLKTKAEHAADSGIPTKYIVRPLRYLTELQLLSYQKKGNCYQIDFHLPVVTFPPPEVRWELWSTNRRKNAGFSAELRRRIYELDDGICAYCEQPVPFEDVNIDHIYPDSKGGADSEPNLTIACGSCNSKKWSWTPEDSDYLTPRRFRGKSVSSMLIEEVNGFKQPRFVFHKESV